MELVDRLQIFLDKYKDAIKYGGSDVSTSTWAIDLERLIEQEYEPVQLEPLTDEEIGNLEWTETPAYPNYNADFTFVDDYPLEVRRISEATITKNQAKGQLYRIRA